VNRIWQVRAFFGVWAGTAKEVYYNILTVSRHHWFLLLLAGFMGVPIARSEFIADGAVLTGLTDDGKSVAVAWAPHGSWIVYAREVSNSQKQLHIM
jgi:hypothetical protein